MKRYPGFKYYNGEPPPLLLRYSNRIYLLKEITKSKAILAEWPYGDSASLDFLEQIQSTLNNTIEISNKELYNLSLII